MHQHRDAARHGGQSAQKQARDLGQHQTTTKFATPCRQSRKRHSNGKIESFRSFADRFTHRFRARTLATNGLSGRRLHPSGGDSVPLLVPSRFRTTADYQIVWESTVFRRDASGFRNGGRVAIVTLIVTALRIPSVMSKW